MEIQVTGTSTVEAPADQATVRFSLGLSGNDKTAVIAQTVELSNAARAEFEALQEAGAVRSFALESIQTWARYRDDAIRITRRPETSARVSGKADFVDFGELGRFVASASGRTGWDIHGVSWDLQRQSRRALEPQVVSEAFENARERAGWLAAAAGASGLVVVEIADPESMVPVAMLGRGGLGRAAAESIEFVPDTVKVTANVQVRFRAELADRS